MNRMILTTDKGKVFDWFLNRYINFILWFKMIDNEEDAIKETAAQIVKIEKLFL